MSALILKGFDALLSDCKRFTVNVVFFSMVLITSVYILSNKRCDLEGMLRSFWSLQSALYTGAVVVVLLLALFVIKKAMRRRGNDFKAHFATEHPVSGDEIQIMQKFVERRLCEIAIAFQDAREVKREFVKSTSPIDIDRVKEARNRLRKLEADILKRKKTFWAAQNIARFFGFQVYRSVKEYWAIK